MTANTYSTDAPEVRIHGRQISFSEVEASDKVPSIISAPDSWDAWRHERYYRVLLPLTNSAPSAEWLTIGDSGADVFWLKKHGVKRVVATSLTDTQMKNLISKKLLDCIETRSIDAHDIDLPDESFDYTMCKEAYHHFERPAVGLYEMLRVSRKAVIMLCEPCCSDRWYILDVLKRNLKIVLRKNTPWSDPEFEASGNYIYGLSLRETTKIATALQIGPIFHSYLSDFWVPGLVSRPKSDKLAAVVMHSAVGLQNCLSRLGLMSWGKITIIVFKSEPSPATANALKRAGLRRMAIKRNPHI